MKVSNLKSVAKKTALAGMMFIVFAGSAAAQSAKLANYKFKENSVKNIINGISEENNGVRKGSIYLAGKFMIEDAVDALIYQLENEKIPAYRAYIVLSLYKIGDRRGLETVYRYAVKDPDIKVRTISTAIYAEMQKTQNDVAFFERSR